MVALRLADVLISTQKSVSELHVLDLNLAREAAWLLNCLDEVMSGSFLLALCELGHHHLVSRAESVF